MKEILKELEGLTLRAEALGTRDGHLLYAALAAVLGSAHMGDLLGLGRVLDPYSRAQLEAIARDSDHRLPRPGREDAGT